VRLSWLVLSLFACGPAEESTIDSAPPVDGPSGDVAPADAAGADVLDMDRVTIPAGPFSMGCNPAIEADCASYPDESPYHALTISTFAIDRVEVTQAKYQACIDAGACGTPVAGWPPAADPTLYAVANVTWSNANDYCQWAGGRLPTEAEWEKAARGTQGPTYPWGEDPPDCEHAPAIDDGCGNDQPTVGSAPLGASPYGVLDMAGGLTEWVSDFYDPAYYATSPATDPPGPASGSLHVRRGGGFTSDPAALRTSARTSTPPDPAAGFRCARGL